MGPYSYFHLLTQLCTFIRKASCSRAGASEGAAQALQIRGAPAWRRTARADGAAEAHVRREDMFRIIDGHIRTCRCARSLFVGSSTDWTRCARASTRSSLCFVLFCLAFSGFDALVIVFCFVLSRILATAGSCEPARSIIAELISAGELHNLNLFFVCALNGLFFVPSHVSFDRLL